jgi:hypothetical protein
LQVLKNEKNLVKSLFKNLRKSLANPLLATLSL